jgi:deoxyhypusine synthase
MHPEHEGRRLQKHIFKIWKDADDKGNVISHEFMYKMFYQGVLEEYYEIDLKDSWMYAAAEKNLHYCSRMGR